MTNMPALASLLGLAMTGISQPHTTRDLMYFVQDPVVVTQKTPEELAAKRARKHAFKARKAQRGKKAHGRQ